MLRFYNCLFLICIQVALMAQPTPPITAITYNLRYDTPRDGINRWDNRKAWLADQLRFYEPAIFGIQEGLAHQVEYLDTALMDYRYVGVGRDDGAQKGEFSAIFFDTTRFVLLREATFWLSPTPFEPSKGWDAALPRVCTYALLLDRRSERPLWVFNTHFDHVGVEARAKSVELIIQRIQTLVPPDEPAILMGDLNLEPDSPPIQLLSRQLLDTHRAARLLRFGPEGTFNGFSFDQPAERRIDYIFIKPNMLRVDKYAVLTDSKEQRYPSDHFPVLAVLAWE